MLVEKNVYYHAGNCPHRDEKGFCLALLEEAGYYCGGGTSAPVPPKILVALLLLKRRMRNYETRCCSFHSAQPAGKYATQGKNIKIFRRGLYENENLYHRKWKSYRRSQS